MLSDNNVSNELISNLTSLVNSGKIPQSMIIDGGSEEMREELVKELCCSFMCISVDKPCGKCENCIKINAECHPDVIYVQAQDKKKTISVDVIRKMREDAFVLPNESDHKIYIIRQADTLQPYAQNALLKILEEPPEYASFIMLCDYHTSLLQTVLSRSVVFNIGASQATKLDEKKQKVAEEVAGKIATAIANKNEFELLMLTGKFDKNTELFKYTLTLLENIFRDALILSQGGNTMITNYNSEAKMLSQSLEPEKLIELINKNRDIMFKLDNFANTNLTMTRLCSTLIKVL